jgi:hypothetical protein
MNNRFVLVVSLLVFAGFQAGCRSRSHSTQGYPIAQFADASHAEITTAVVAYMAESPESKVLTDPLFLLDLTETDFREVDKLLKAKPWRFRYARRPYASHLGQREEILTVRVKSCDGSQAIAEGSFGTRSSFAIYKYRLRKGPQGWHVESSELVLAS